MTFLFALALAVSTPAFANETHEAKAVEVKTYDAAKHDVVVVVDGHDVELHTEHAVVHGEIAVGKHVDVSYEGDQAHVITVH